MTVGLFGGTFAPFHRGHRAALESFLREVKPDRCIVMPSGVPPHKIKTTLFTDRQRLETARLGCEGLKGVTVSDWEIKKEGRSYTAETLRWLNETYPDRRAVLYVGSDMFLTLHQWYRPEEIFRRAKIAAFSRTGTDLEQLNAHAAWLATQYPHVDCTVYTAPPFPVSSTEIRELWCAGGDVSHLVPPKVADYLTKLREGGAE